MPGPLSNVRHERFVGLLLEGRSASAAYAQAGYAPDDANAAKLKAHPRVQERLAELQSEVAKDTKITVESIVGELTDLAAKATNKSQFTAAIRAVVEKARIAGLLVERVEIGSPGDFSDSETPEAIVDRMLSYDTNPYHDVRDEDRQALVEMLKRHAVEMREYVNAIKARPIVGVRLDKPRQLTHGNGKTHL
jgi:Terminase small subunit